MTCVDGENFFEIKKVAEGASPLAGETLRQKDVDKYYGGLLKQHVILLKNLWRASPRGTPKVID